MPPIRSHSTAVDTKSPWDGPAAMREAPNDAKILRYMATWYSGTNPDSKGSYKFPHHKPKLNAPANLRGVNNALARLSQAKIPSGDRAGVEEHLRRHRKDAGLLEALSQTEIIAVVDDLLAEGEIAEDDREQYQAEIEEYESNVMVGSLGLPMSFDELDQERENRERMQTMSGLYNDLWLLFSHVMRESLNSVDQLDRLQDIFSVFITRAEGVLTEEEVLESSRIQENFTIVAEVMDNLIAEDVGTQAMRKPLKVKMALIEPGWGNKKMNRYYPADVLRRDAHVFEGVKVYRTGHNIGQRTEGDEVATVDRILGFSQTGAPLAEVTIFDPDTAEKTRNRALADKLPTLEGSILGSGEMSEFNQSGRKGFRVNRIKKGVSFDFVTRAGAGGRAIELLSESGETENEDGETMTKKEEKEKVEETQEEENLNIAENETEGETETPEESETSEDKTEEVTEDEGPAFLSEEAVSELLQENQQYQNLPEAAQQPLRLGVWLSEDALNEAIKAQVKAVKAASGAGFAPNLGNDLQETIEPSQRMTEDEVQSEYDALFAEMGG